MDIVCPILKTKGKQKPAETEAISEEEVADETEEAPPQPINYEEGFIQINGTKIYGLRTYSIILIIVLVYAYLCIRSGDSLGMKDLALMACGFLFGAKAIRRS